MLAALLVSLAAHAATKQVDCEIDGYTPPAMWQNEIAKATIAIDTKPWMGIDQGTASQVLKLPGGEEVVLDAKWTAGVLANDDITVIPQPTLSVVARFQSAGQILDLQSGSSHEKPPKDLWAQFQMNNLPALAKVMKDPHESNDALQRESTPGVLQMIEIGCHTSSQ